MDENVFGYLLIPRQRLRDYEVIKIIARDYWRSTVEMNKKNSSCKTEFCCCVVCLKCLWWQCKKLSMKTGIPMKNIVTVFGLKNDKKLYLDFARLVDLDSMNKDAFFGRTKVYASEKEIPRRKINSRTEVVYAE